MNCVIFDTETTGINEPVIVEAAYIAVLDLYPLRFGDGQSARFNPGKPIELGALATHHIADEDVADAPPAESFSLPDGTEYVIGHNVDFDMRAIGDPPVRRICTLALCRKLWPEADSHSQTAMLYLLDREYARQHAQNAHSASADVRFCGRILDHILNRLRAATIEGLWIESEAARIPDVMPFGKHKGARIVEIPSDYRRWLLNQPDVDPYLRRALGAAR